MRGIDVYARWKQALQAAGNRNRSTFVYRNHRVAVSVAAVPGMGFCGFARVTYRGASADVPTPSWYATAGDARRRAGETARTWIDAGFEADR